MTTPSNTDIKNLKEKVEGFAKKLNTDGSPKKKVSLDESYTKGLIRDAVRSKWMYAPNKLHFLLSSRIPDMNTLTRTKWLQQCNICMELFKETDVEVDHIVGNTEFIDVEKFREYAAKILDAGEEDLQILCKECHALKTTCERVGLDWRTPEGLKRGRQEQDIITLCKLKATPQKEWLLSKGITPESNASKRKLQIREVILNE